MCAALAFSQACENNKAPILEVLKTTFSQCQRVLEIGSGTGQHAVYFAHHLPDLSWQTSDLLANHKAINQWLAHTPSPNIKAPLTFDLRTSDWPGQYDAVYSANTAHIVSWPLVQRMFALVGEALAAGGVFALYGPFNYGGEYTSDSNREFDTFLRARDPASGIRDIDNIKQLAEQSALALVQDNPMPANNRLLVFHSVRE